MTNPGNFVTHLECSLTGEHYEPGRPHNLSKAAKPLLVRYDLEALARTVTKADLATRPEDLWRYREFLPIRDSANIITLGEVPPPPRPRQHHPPRRGPHAAHRLPRTRPPPRRPLANHQRRRPPPHRLLQSPWTRHGRLHGKRTRHPPPRDAPQR